MGELLGLPPGQGAHNRESPAGDSTLPKDLVYELRQLAKWREHVLAQIRAGVLGMTPAGPARVSPPKRWPGRGDLASGRVASHLHRTCNSVSVADRSAAAK
jgi:hypothetical protein